MAVAYASAAKLKELDTEAERLVEEGAPAREFERLRKEGWTPLSHRQLDTSIQPCPPDCGACHPPVKLRRRREP
jgi:hypothetical protein